MSSTVPFLDTIITLFLEYLPKLMSMSFTCNDRIRSESKFCAPLVTPDDAPKSSDGLILFFALKQQIFLHYLLHICAISPCFLYSTIIINYVTFISLTISSINIQFFSNVSFYSLFHPDKYLHLTGTS